jgi:muramidase (phage lysozyme)
LLEPVLSIYQHSRLACLLLSAAGLMFSGPAFASEVPSEWNLTPAPRPFSQVALLPPLPEVPLSYAVTAERRALLNTIRFAEGTWAEGQEVGYRVMFGGSLTPSLEYHPNRVMYSSRYASAAAGAYQFMPFTWALASRSLGLRGFHPQAQDQAALFLIQRRGALPLADRGEMTPELAALLSPEWASFPTLQGGSFYGQPVKRFEELKNFYDSNLSQIRAGGGQGPWERVAVRRSAQTCRDDSLSCRLNGISAADTGVNP